MQRRSSIRAAGVTLFLAAVTLAPTCNFDAEIHVAPDGVAANPGTPEAPWDLATANARAMPGDTFILHGGAYSTSVVPSRSGTRHFPITYEASPGETPLLTKSAPGEMVCFNLTGRSWVRVNGLHCDGGGVGPAVSGVKRWALLRRGARHNVIENCVLHHAWNHGIVIRDSSYNIIRNNQMYLAGDDERQGEAIRIQDAHHNLVEGNEILLAGHNLIQIWGSWRNIVRGNWLTNPWYRIGTTMGIRARHNVIEGNLIESSATDMPEALAGRRTTAWSVRSPRGLYRRNVFHGNGVEDLRLVARQSDDRRIDGNRVVHNVFHGGVGPALRIRDKVDDPTGTPNQIGEIKFMNNVVIRDETAPEQELQILVELDEATQPEPLAGIRIRCNDLFHRSPAEATILVRGGAGRGTLADFERSDPTHFSDNMALDPLFVNAASGDYTPARESPLRDEGCFLTSTRTAGSGRFIPVEDARFFMDGFGIVLGDQIRLEGREDLLRVFRVEYEPGVLVVDRNIHWEEGTGVALAYANAGPDLGVLEDGDCANGRDDDGDGDADAAEDAGCVSADDVSEVLGDLDSDEDVDEDDRLRFLSAFGRRSDDPEFAVGADVDRDGLVSWLDYQIWIAAWRNFGSQP